MHMVGSDNPPSGQPAGEVMAVAMADTWQGPYRPIADNITVRQIIFFRP